MGPMKIMATFSVWRYNLGRKFFTMQLLHKNLGIACLLACASQLAHVSPASANLVKNGGFENSTANDTSTWPTSAGGIGQIQLGSPNAPTEALLVNLSDWTKSMVSDDGSSGFAFVINADADKKLSGSTYPNQGGGFPSKFSNSANTNIFLWGPQYNGDGGPVPNSFSGPPDSLPGNKFLGADGDYGASILSQVITGFDASKNYVLSFEYAGAQETGEEGDTKQEWRVNLGGLNFTTPQWINPTKGFTPWQTYTSAPFSGSGLEGQTLSFESWGRAVVSGSLPPFLLLDNVTILEHTPPPPPSVPGPLPALGAAAAMAVSRKLRRRIAAAKPSSRA
jgi:hypothetical protein